MEKPKKYELFISEPAEDEIKALKDFYDDRMSGLGNEFLIELEKSFDRILNNPEQFPKYKNRLVKKAQVDRFPFSVFFAVKGQVINVLAIFHQSRNPRKLSKRF
jgi:plasmid stabilization system protein ParE